MTQKLRKTLIMVVMAALIICLMAASLTYTFTYGRYAGGKFDNENSPYGDLIEFVGANQYIVRTPEELIQAIEDGYSNIKIADDAEKPFVIDTGVTDVSANLVLDVNGKTLIRNSRNPMLDVQTNVSVVLIYDSSDEEQGGFYNPVGSALQASGGTLTVGSGNYDDGPEKEEYNTLDSVSTTTAYLVTRANRTSAYGEPAEVDNLPQVGGNVYYSTETGGENTEPEGVNKDYIKDDTFLLYTIERDCFVGDGSTTVNGVTSEKGMLYTNAEQTGEGENRVLSAEQLTVACDVASCDFYYYYPIGGTTETAEVPQDYAVIYGYWDVKKMAADEEGMATSLSNSGLVYPFAAVRMVEGEGFARGGQFSNNFGTVNSYGIYANGGALTASGANFTTGGDGVCIRCEGSASLSISGGTYSSAIGNTIEMQGGTMNVTAGKFTKSGGKGIGSGEEQAQQQRDNQTAMIALGGNGTLEIEGTATGEGENKTYSVTMTAGGTDNGGTLENVFGIRADGGGTVTTAGVRFDIYGDYSAGVLSYDGTINLDDDTFIKVTQSDNNKDENDNTLLTSSAVSSEASSGGDHPITMNGSVQIESNGLGITARGNINVKSGATTTVETPRGTGIYVNGGTFNVESGAEISVESAVQNGYAWGLPPEGVGTSPNIYNGVYVQGGSLTSEGELNVTFTGVASDANATNRYSSYAVSVETGDATLENGIIAGKKAGGIYVSGGTVTAGDVTVSAGGTVSNNSFDANDPTYAAGILVENGTVHMNGADVYSTALGIAVVASGDGGTARVNVTGTNSVTATRATGVYVENGTVTNSGILDVTSTISTTWEHEGADFNFAANRYNGVYVQGGSLDSKGTLNVTFTGVENDAPAANADGDSLFRTFEIKSYAVRVEGDDSTTVTIASGTILNGTRDTNGTVIAGSGIGGGILVNGGSVTLGSSTSNSGPTVQTTGTGYHHNENDDAAYRYRPAFSKAGNWYYYLPSTGGSAVKVDGGTLTVYGGDYSATQGDGIVTVNGTTTIRGGSFRGNDNYTTEKGSPQAGPGASYAFKVYGGTAEVYGGTFGGNINNVWSKTSGAFVMGTSDVRGTANIYGGTFEVGGGNNGNEGGQAGFSIYQYATVNFAPQDGKKIFVNGRATAIAIEQTDGNSNSTVTISGGNFASTSTVLDNSDGIWYGNGSTTLNISSGTFTGAARSGLWLDVRVPENGNVHLTGGTYYGNPVRSGSWPAYYWNNGGISAQSNGLIDGNGYWIGVNYIFDDGYMASCYYDDSYHDEYDDSALNQTTSRSEHVKILQR